MTEVRTPSVIHDGVNEPSPRKRYRHPSDVARLVFSLLLIGALLLLGVIAPDGVRSVSSDILAVVDRLPDAISDGLVGVVQLAAIIAPFVVVLVLVRRRRFELLFILAAAAGIAAVAMALTSGLVDDSVPLADLGFDGVNSWLIGSQFPSSSYLGALTAMLVAASPWLPRAWRITGWFFVMSLVVARGLTASEVPLRSGLLLAIGAASGSLALVIFGAPRRRIDTASVAAALGEAGVVLDDLQPLDSARVDPTFVGRGVDDGTQYAVKVLGRDQRDADLLLSMWRTITVKGLGDSGAIGLPSRAVQREALAMGIFAGAGASTPRPVAVIGTVDEAAVLAMTAAPGAPLSDTPRDDVSDAALANLWGQIAMLQRRRLAHRSLSADNVMIDDESATLIGLRRADLQATDEVLGADVAELLTTLAVTVGPDRALESASRALEPDTLARAVPLIQPAVFTRPTRESLDEMEDGDGFLDDLRDRVADVAGVDQVELAPVQRITLGGAVSLVGSIVLVWYIFSLASDWDQIWDAFALADLVYVIPIFALAMATYLTGAMSMQGAVPIDLPFWRTTSVMFGQSFLNRFTPANAGGMAMRVRYLQLSGLDGTVAATSIGLTSAASGVAQGLMIVVFLFWGGASDRFSDFEFPDIGSIVIIVLAIGLVATVVLASTWGRTVVRPWLGNTIDKIRAMVGEVAKNPRKMSQLFGGAVLGKLANIIAFWLSVLAFDVDISLPKAGALYIVATTIGSAVPTPGGVGGVEAALTAALLSFGVDNATAAAIVLLFRILTFWLPTLPGYGFLRYTQRAGIV